jgi:hypothetical protein
MIPERCRPPMGLYPAELAKVCRLGRLACPVKTKAKESNRPDDNQVWLAEPLEALSRAFGAREILESGRKLCGDSPWRNKLWRTAVTSYVKLASVNQEPVPNLPLGRFEQVLESGLVPVPRWIGKSRDRRHQRRKHADEAS